MVRVFNPQGGPEQVENLLHQFKLTHYQISPRMPLLMEGDLVEIGYIETQESVVPIRTLTLKEMNPSGQK